MIVQTVASRSRQLAEKPPQSMAPPFMHIGTNDIGKLVMRASPLSVEGQWKTAECSLVGAVIACWFGDVISAARGQWRKAHRLELAVFGKLCGREREAVDAYAAMLGLAPTWIDSVLCDLQLGVLA